MIAFGVKILFFVLSLTGLFSSSIVLYAFGRVVGQQWAPMLFCAGNAILQGIFCLGMIYRMDPFLMPRPFCITQTIVISIATYLMTGAAGAVSFATSLAVLKPKTWGEGGRTLKWRSIYLYPTVVFPVVASIIHTVFVFKFNSVHPSDDLHCDSTHPEWVRFLSYAGVPFIPGLPALYFSIKSIRCVYKTHQHLQRSRYDSSEEFSQLEGLPRKTDFQSPFGAISTTQSPTDSHRREQIVPGPTPRQFHLPFKTLPLTGEPSESSHFSAQEIGTDERDSTISMSFPTFTNLGHGPNLIREDGRLVEQPDGWQAEIHNVGRPASSILTEVPRARVDDAVQSTEWIADKDGAESNFEYSRVDYIMGDGPRTMSAISRSKSRQPPNLAPAVWRIIIFQVAFVAVQFLTCISTVIDVVTLRPTPTPFGTQHIALLLAAWGPVVVFGHLPAVFRNLIPWRELKS